MKSTLVLFTRSHLRRSLRRGPGLGSALLGHRHVRNRQTELASGQKLSRAALRPRVLLSGECALPYPANELASSAESCPHQCRSPFGQTVASLTTGRSQIHVVARHGCERLCLPQVGKMGCPPAGGSPPLAQQWQAASLNCTRIVPAMPHSTTATGSAVVKCQELPPIISIAILLPSHSITTQLE